MADLTENERAIGSDRDGTLDNLIVPFGGKPVTRELCSAFVKLDRAEELVSQVEQECVSKPAYRYILEENARTGIKCFRPLEVLYNKLRISSLVGDAIHNLSASLDHAYHEIVYPNAPSNKKRQVQFPVCNKKEKFSETAKRRQAYTVGEKFVAYIEGLQPYQKDNSPSPVYQIYQLDVRDKHRELIEMSNSTSLSGRLLRSFAPDCPMHLDSTVIVGQSRADVVWRASPLSFNQWIAAGYQLDGNKQTPVDVQVDLVLLSDLSPCGEPLMHKLQSLVKNCRSAVVGLQAF